MNMWEFFHQHPFIAWCALWLVWIIVPVTTLAFRVVNRILRSINVALRGWPPPHLDADGDFKAEPETDAVET